MGLIACKWLTAEVIALANSRKGIRRKLGGDFLTQNSFQALNNEIFEGCPTPCGGNFCPRYNAFR
jgi:hypothetical protein